MIREKREARTRERGVAMEHVREVLMISANREARTPTLSQEPGASARASGSTEEGERERGNGREGKVEARVGRWR